MITRADALSAAEKAAQAAYWYDDTRRPATESSAFCALDMPIDRLARFVETHPDAPAEAVYRFAVAGKLDVKTWTEIGAPLRVALEIFRAGYLALLVLVRADEAEAADRKRAEAADAARKKLARNPLFEPAFEGVEGAGERVVLSSPAASKARKRGKA